MQMSHETAEMLRTLIIHLITSKFYVKKGLQLNLLLYTPSNGLKTTRNAKKPIDGK